MQGIEGLAFEDDDMAISMSGVDKVFEPDAGEPGLTPMKVQEKTHPVDKAAADHAGEESNGGSMCPNRLRSKGSTARQSGMQAQPLCKATSSVPSVATLAVPPATAPPMPGTPSMAMAPPRPGTSSLSLVVYTGENGKGQSKGRGPCPICGKLYASMPKHSPYCYEHKQT
eukprot:1563180-Amphidinium_carterae.1